MLNICKVCIEKKNRLIPSGLIRQLSFFTKIQHIFDFPTLYYWKTLEENNLFLFQIWKYKCDKAIFSSQTLCMAWSAKILRQTTTDKAGRRGACLQRVISSYYIDWFEKKIHPHGFLGEVYKIMYSLRYITHFFPDQSLLSVYLRYIVMLNWKKILHGKNYFPIDWQYRCGLRLKKYVKPRSKMCSRRFENNHNLFWNWQMQ